MHTLVAQIAPQRSTQYAALANALAPHELQLSPLGKYMSELTPITLGGQAYLQFKLDADLDPTLVQEMGMLSMTSAFFESYAQIGKVAGPLLRPIETQFEPAFSPDLAMTRRYRGKTNELFTHFMCNIARFSSALAHRPWNTLRVFDPLCGGGTTLFTALVLGAYVAGVDQNANDIQSTVAFVKQYTREEGIACKIKQERLKKIGRRWIYEIGKTSPRKCILANGDTTQSPDLISGFKPHLIVADLPYGIQHKGKLVDLLSTALPVWATILPPSGALVLAWEARQLTRQDMIDLVQSSCPLTVLNDPPYDALAHRVDRVIKERDLVVARPSEALRKEQS